MTDHCTWWPDRMGSMDWSHCCAAHDLAYVTGAPRAAADADLYACVAAATGTPALAAVMFVGVSLFGWLFWRARTAT